MVKVLIAEDDPAVQEFVSRALAHIGYEVSAVDDGSRALEALAVDSFDLLITDIVMPELDGIALALKAAKEHPNMAILMMTGYAHERQRAHNLDKLIHKVIAKPFNLAEITQAARNAVAEKQSET